MALIKVDTYYHHGISASIRTRVGTLLWVFSKEGGDIYLHIVRSLSTLSSAHALNVTLRTRSDRITEKEKKARWKLTWKWSHVLLIIIYLYWGDEAKNISWYNRRKAYLGDKKYFERKELLYSFCQYINTFVVLFQNEIVVFGGIV